MRKHKPTLLLCQRLVSQSVRLSVCENFEIPGLAEQNELNFFGGQLRQKVISLFFLRKEPVRQGLRARAEGQNSSILTQH